MVLLLQCISCKKNLYRKFTSSNTGFYGDKILYKNLKFFDKIFVPTFCRRRFRNAPYREKILSMGKCDVWGMVSTNLFRLFYVGEIQNLKGKRHNRVHPGHFATQQGTPFYPAGMSTAGWPTLVFTLPRWKIARVHPTKATFFQNCTLILDKYPVVSENETLPPAISPAEITLRSRQRAPKYTSSRAKHTVRNRHQGPASSSSA